jgi:hypothetical protein
MGDINDEIDKTINELKEFQKNEELKKIEKLRMEEEEDKERNRKLEVFRKEEEADKQKAILANKLSMENLFEDKDHEINNEDLKRYDRLNPLKFKTKKVLSSEGKKKVKADKEAQKIKQIKIDSLSNILRKRDKFCTLIEYNDDMQLMLTERMVTVNEIVDYSGKVIAAGKRIEFGIGGYFYVFDNRDMSYTMYNYKNESKDLTRIISLNSEHELIAEIEKMDPGRRYGFKYRYFPPQVKSTVVVKTKEEIKEELERNHKEEMEEFDRLFGTAEEVKPNNNQESIDDEFEKLFGS